MSYTPPADSDPAEIVPYLWRGIKAGHLAFEVGANQGQSLPRMRGLFDRVIAFEPYFPSYELASQVEGVDVRQVAISDRDGHTELTLLEHQFRSDGHEAALRMDFTLLPKHWVRSAKLDTIAGQEGYPDFINMDIEGHELTALKGAEKVLEMRKASWLIEFHSVDQHAGCMEVLMEYCRSVETVRHPHYPDGSREYFMHGWLIAHADA